MEKVGPTENPDESRNNSIFELYSEDFGITIDGLRGKKILDMPAGTEAKFVEYCLKQGIDIVGMDAQELETQDSEVKKHFIQGHVQENPLRRETFDLILIRALPSYAHWRIFNESLPLLKRGGTIKWAPFFQETNSDHKKFLNQVITSQEELGYRAEVKLITMQKTHSGEVIRYCLTVQRS